MIAGRAYRKADGGYVPPVAHQRMVTEIVESVGRGLPERWRYGLMDAFEQYQDVHAIRAKVRSVKAAITASDAELRAYAEAAAQQCGFAMRYGDKGGALRVAHGVAARHGVGHGKLSYCDPLTWWRACDSVWWLRQIRRSHALTMESGAIALGLVNRDADCYVSRESVARHRQQQARNAQTIANCDAVADDGERVNLAQIVEHSIANKAIRRGELMTRLNGFQQVGDDLGHCALFATITCPSRMHRYKGRERVRPNPRYDGTLPIAAHRYLCGVWARIRAELHREGVRVYGFRTVEGHHDGAPHWHLLLWCESVADRSAVRECIAKHALRDSPDEPGAQKHRVELKNMWRGQAVAYISKYIAKGTDGHGLELDLFGNPIADAVERVQVWASTWGVRQFQQIGGPPIGVWRELRRIDRESLNSEHWIADHVVTCNKGENGRVDFAGFVMAQGGPFARRRDMPLAVARDGRMRPTRYGERVTAKVNGVVQKETGDVFVTRSRSWTIQRRDSGAVSVCRDKGRALLARHVSASPLGPVSITIRGERKAVSDGVKGDVFGGGGERAAVFSAEWSAVYCARRRGNGGASGVSSGGRADSEWVIEGAQ